jgi:hypothetical protein
MVLGTTKLEVKGFMIPLTAETSNALSPAFLIHAVREGFPLRVWVYSPKSSAAGVIDTMLLSWYSALDSGPWRPSAV